MVFCSIIQCGNLSATCNYTNKVITFHRFPHNADIKDKWISAMGKRNWFPTPILPNKNSHICSTHFTEDDFNKSNKRRTLIKTAVEAEEHHIFLAGGWFGGLENKLNGVMHDVFQSIKQSPHNMPLRVSPHRRLIDTIPDVSTTTDAITEDITFGINDEDFVIGKNYEDTYPNVTLNNSKKFMPFDMTYGDEYASGLSEENSVSYQTEETEGPQQNHKKKKKVKRNKKKLKPKSKVTPKKWHVEKKNIEIARTEKARLRVEKAHVDKALQENLAEGKPEPKARVSKIKLRRKKASKFVKATVDNKFNDSESNESLRKRKPVDIIVHIKMNE